MSEMAIPDTAKLWDVIASAREHAPLVHNITNNVMQAGTAEVIAAVGGTQATVHNVEEARDLAEIASSAAINTGTPDRDWMTCAQTAVETVRKQNKPWVLDPVACGLLPFRDACVRTLLEYKPSVIKGNASELMALAGMNVKPHGADSRHMTEDAEESVRALARLHGATVVVTGAVDVIDDGSAKVFIHNGHPLLPKIIGSGCMVTAIIGVYLAVAPSPLEAAAAALAVMGIAAEIAAETALGPGTMKPALLDALYNMDKGMFAERLRLG